MNIETRFEVGDTIFTIDPDTLKVAEYEVESVTTIANCNGVTSYVLPRGKGAYRSIEERKCFRTREELIDHVTKP